MADTKEIETHPVQIGELVSRGTDNALAPFRCPTCDKQNTEWPLTTHDVHETAQ